MFGLSLIAALGTAFLAGPTLAGEIESGMALAVLARPVRRSAVLLGKWLGLVGVRQRVRRRRRARPVRRRPADRRLLAAATRSSGCCCWPRRPIVLLTLGLLLSTVISPMASGIVAVGLFGATWIAGVVGGVGDALGNDGVARVGTVSRMLLPTDGLWRGAMHAFQDPSRADRRSGRDGERVPVPQPGPAERAPTWGGSVVWVADDRRPRRAVVRPPRRLSGTRLPAGPLAAASGGAHGPSS